MQVAEEDRRPKKGKNVLAPGWGSRIKIAADLLGDRKSAAAKAQVSLDSLARYIREEVQPPFDAIAMLCRSAAVPMEWVAFDQGSMLVTNESADTGEFVSIPVYDVEASAGHGAALTDERVVSQVMFRKDFLARERLTPACLGMISARGDSMPISAPDGALLLVDTSVRRVIDSAIYVLRLDHQLLVKRLQRFVDGAIDVISENPAYRTERIEPHRVADLDVVGQVKLSSHRV